MRHIKKCLALCLCAALALGSAVPGLAASDFSDLDGHWAESYIEDLYERGYISGYEDGTMRPDNEITACEALVFLSRFYELTSDELSFLYDDWGSIAEDYVPSSLSWANEEVAVCLAAGIITEDELDELDLSAEIEKELLCVFLVRALTLEDDALDLTGIELPFGDADEISPEHTGYIAQLVSMDIITGDDNGNFTPKLGVTRAMAATLVSRGLEYVEDEDIELTIDGYSGLVRTFGIIAGADDDYVQLRGEDGLVREFRFADGASVTVNGRSTSITSSHIGDEAEFSVINGEISAISVSTDSNVEWVQGRISRVTSSKSGEYLIVDDLISGEDVRIDVESGSEITLDGDEAELADLTSGQFATARIGDDELDVLSAVTFSDEISGEVSSVIYGPTVQLKVESGSVTYVFLLDIGDLPEIERGKTEITIDRVNAGDDIEVTIDDSEIEKISISAAESGVTAVLNSITVNPTGTFWTLEDNSGNEATYQLDSMAAAYWGSKDISISDIKVGDTVSVSLSGTVITEVELIDSVQSSDKFSAEILSADSGKKTITLLYNERLVYVDASDATIISASTGSSVKLSALKAGSTVTVYGSFVSSNSFEATSIIVEN